MIWVSAVSLMGRPALGKTPAKFRRRVILIEIKFGR